MARSWRGGKKYRRRETYLGEYTLFISPRLFSVDSVFICFEHHDSWMGDVLIGDEEDKLFGFGMPRSSDVVVAPPYEVNVGRDGECGDCS